MVIVELDEPVIAEHRERLADGVEVCTAKLAKSPERLRFGPAYRLIRRIRADIGVFVKGWPQVATVSLDLACRLAFRGSFLTIEQLAPPYRGPKSTGRHFGGLIPGLGLWWYAAGLKLYVRSIFPKRIVTVSRAIASELVQHYGFPIIKVVPISNGIDAKRFAPDRAARVKVRASWGVPEGAIVFGTVSRLSNFHKGLDIAIDMFAQLCAANPDRLLWCVLVGSGPDDATLKSQARATEWSSRILFPGPTERPWEVCCGIDVFLMPSHFEGMPLALLEGMACGCCPVVMGVGGITEIVCDATLGWLAPPDDREAFLRGMQAALALGADGRAAMGARVRQHVIEHFAEEQFGKLADLIERC